MKYHDIKTGMVLKLKRDRQSDYGMIQDRVTVLGLKDRKGYKVGHVFASYLERDSCGTRMASGYFRPADFQECIGWDKAVGHTPECIEVNDRSATEICTCK